MHMGWEYNIPGQMKGHAHLSRTSRKQIARNQKRMYSRCLIITSRWRALLKTKRSIYFPLGVIMIFKLSLIHFYCYHIDPNPGGVPGQTIAVCWACSNLLHVNINAHKNASHDINNHFGYWWTKECNLDMRKKSSAKKVNERSQVCMFIIKVCMWILVS